MSFRGWTGNFCALLAVVALGAPVTGRGGQAPPAPRAAAPIDLTGYWVAVVTQEWRYRMVTPAKGDIAGVPVTPEAANIANKWDPQADERDGYQCRSYGAPAIMRVPGRLHITWADDQTLQLETDAGMQKRVFRFGGAASPGAPSWQGSSLASWELPAASEPYQLLFFPFPNKHPVNGTLKVVTKNLLPGYLRKNGVPYSEDTVLTEYFNIVSGPKSTPWLLVTTSIEDPRYLTEPFLFSTQFKKQSDSAGWDPTPCSSTW